MLVQKEFNFEKADAYLEKCIREAVQDATVCYEEDVEEAHSLIFILMKIRNGLRNFNHDQKQKIILKTNGSCEGVFGKEYAVLQMIGFIELPFYNVDEGKEKAFLCDCYDAKVEEPEYHYYLYEAGAHEYAEKKIIEIAKRFGVVLFEVDIFDNLDGKYNALLSAENKYLYALGACFDDDGEDEDEQV